MAGPNLHNGTMITLVVDGDPGDRLQRAFSEALPGRVHRLPAHSLPEGRLAEGSRSCLCVSPELADRIRRQGWRDGMILALTREQFRRRYVQVRRRDALLFHDVAPKRLRPAVRLAIRGMTLFPPELVPEDERAAPLLECFDQLSEKDRSVMAELALGLSNREIADRLGSSPESVGQVITRIFRHLGCVNRTTVAVLAFGRFSPFLDVNEALPQCWPASVEF